MTSHFAETGDREEKTKLNTIVLLIVIIIQSLKTMLIVHYRECWMHLLLNFHVIHCKSYFSGLNYFFSFPITTLVVKNDGHFARILPLFSHNHILLRLFLFWSRT